MTTTNTMLVYDLTAFGISGENEDQATFTYVAASASVDVLILEDSGASPYDTTFSDDVHDDYTGIESQIAQNDIFGLATTGEAIGLAVQFIVYGSDGSEFYAWIIRTGSSTDSDPIANSDAIFVVETALVDGVDYTFTFDTKTVPPESYSSFAICFASGTRIATPDGQKNVELLKVGDLVKTHAGKDQRIRWIGKRRLGSAELAKFPKLRPVRIVAGALGNGLPVRDLLVSRQHRMLVSSMVAQWMFGMTNVLIPAIKLTEIPGIYVDNSVRQVEYFHLLFDRHEVIFAEEAPTESLFTGPEALKALTPLAREEILTLMPEIKDKTYTPEPAYLLPMGKLQKKLIARHVKNNKPILEAFST